MHFCFNVQVTLFAVIKLLVVEFPHMLSGDAQQCTAIACALLTKPSIVLADVKWSMD